jgi:uncharacterized membrane protein
MDTNFFTEVYSKLVRQHIHYEGYIDKTRNLSVFIIAGMMYFIFGFPQTSSHLIAILGSVTVFVLQIFQSKAFGNNLSVQKDLRLLEEKYLSESAASGSMLQAFQNRSVKPVKFIHSFAATTFKDYILIFLALDVCWFAKLYLYPYAAQSWSEFFNRPAFGFLPGWFFFAFAAGFWLTYFSLAIWYKTTQSKNEI